MVFAAKFGGCKKMASMEEDLECCPLCMEELDLTDKTLQACQCGYQVCLWCWHQIKTECNGRCPACRTPYSEQAKPKASLNPEEVVHRVKSRKQVSKRNSATSSSSNKSGQIAASRRHLTNIRVVQRNLVYLIGLPLSFADETRLKSKECFGQYGRIIKVVVNKSHVSDRSNPTASVYVTFYKPADAQQAIDVLDGYVLDGRMIRASFGTTKYCNFFLRNMSCTNPECLYLHALGREEDSFTKEEMQAGKVSFKDTQPNGLVIPSGMTFPSVVVVPKEKEQEQEPTTRASFEMSIHDPIVQDTTTSLTPIASPPTSASANGNDEIFGGGLNWTSPSDVDETLANLLGVQLTGDLIARERRATESRFAFAQQDLLQQILPNVKISFDQDRRQLADDPAILEFRN